MSTVMMPGLETIEEVDEKVEQAPTWSLICINDDVHPIDLVVLALLAIGLSKEQAIEKTLEIHHTDTARVKSGMTKEDALIDQHKVIQITKAGGRFPGIETSLIEDF